MKKIFYIFLLCALHTEVISQYVFSKKFFSALTYSENKFQRSNTVMQTSDGNYVTSGAGAGGLILSAIKLNYKEDTLWTFASNFGDTLYTQHILKVIEATDHNFVFAGYRLDMLDTIPRKIGFLLKLNSSTGDLLWIQNYSMNQHTIFLKDVKETADKGFVACGSYFNQDSFGGDIDNDSNLVKEENSIQLDLSEFDSGLYTSVYKIDGKQISSKKITVIK
jgi:hypothetical protein